MLIRYTCSRCENETLVTSSNHLKSDVKYQYHKVMCLFCNYDEIVKVRTSQALAINFKSCKN